MKKGNLVIFLCVMVLASLITFRMVSPDVIGDTMDLDGRCAFLTPRGWEIVESYEVRENSIAIYKEAGVFGKELEDLSEMDKDRFKR